jgi:hypothetical protein
MAASARRSKNLAGSEGWTIPAETSNTDLPKFLFLLRLDKRHG